MGRKAYDNFLMCQVGAPIFLKGEIRCPRFLLFFSKKKKDVPWSCSIVATEGGSTDGAFQYALLIHVGRLWSDSRAPVGRL